jgi:nicotinamide riboside kinase
MSYRNYDDWKLSNPDDDGHYIEDTDAIQEDVYFKYLHNRDRRWAYGVINKDGYSITITKYTSIPAIDVDWMEATEFNQNDETSRLRIHYKQFTFIDRDEFVEAYKDAINQLNKVML